MAGMMGSSNGAGPDVARLGSLVDLLELAKNPEAIQQQIEVLRQRKIEIDSSLTDFKAAQKAHADRAAALDQRELPVASASPTQSGRRAISRPSSAVAGLRISAAAHADHAVHAGRSGLM